MLRVIGDVIRRAQQWREGGHVQRVHGTPHIGSYDVAQHSYHAAMLALLLHPTMLDKISEVEEGRLLLAILWHDLHERYLGDLYGPAKVRFPKLGSEYETCQVRVDTTLGLDDVIGSLSDENKIWLDAVDALELQMFAEDQAAFGNRHTEQIRKRVAHRLATSNPPPIINEFLSRFTWRRTEEDEAT